MANTTWNPSDKHANITLSGGNLIAKNTVGLQPCLVRTVDRQVSGKFYWEATFDVAGISTTAVGMVKQSLATTDYIAGGIGTTIGTVGVNSTGQVQCDNSATVSIDGGSVVVGLGTITAGTVVCIAVDLTNRLAWFRLGAAGNWNASASRNPATGSGGIFCKNLGIGIPAYPAVNVVALNDQITANFGDSAFTGAAPAGFTSGFTAGASIPTNVLATQAAAEHWGDAPSFARLTQIAAEHWATVDTGTTYAVLTQIGIEHWASVAPAPPVGGTLRVMVLG